MKKIYYLLAVLLSAIGLGSCSGDENGMETKETYQLTFQVINYEQTGFESSSRATGSTDGLHIAMAIYDAQTNTLVQEPTIHQAGSTDVGTFSARLAKGEYNIVFLAYPTSKALIAEDPMAIRWDAEVVRETYLKTLNISVNKDTNTQQEIVLSRVVGMFRMNSKGTETPGNFHHFRLQMQGAGYQLNALTGLAGSELTRDYVLTSQETPEGDASISQSCYAFLPQEECEVDITLIAEDKDNNEIRKRTFSKVPMKVNRLTRYVGDFFNEASDNAFSVKTDDAEWEELDKEF